MTKNNFETNLQKRLNLLKDKRKIYLFISSPNQYKKLNNYMLYYYTKKRKKLGIYVTLNNDRNG